VELMLVRHTEVDVPPGIIYGRTDVPLAPTFETERLAVADRVRHFWPDGPTRVVSSTATRARRLADHLRHLGNDLDVHHDDRLVEVGFGAWEMRAWADVDKDHLNAWMADYVSVRPPQGELLGEHLGDLAARVSAAIDDAIAHAEESKTERTLIVCHGAVIRAGLAVLLGLPLSQSFRLEVDKGSVSRVGFRGTGDNRRPLILGINYR
jgi:alpha-ribazole phosphatase